MLHKEGAAVGGVDSKLREVARRHGLLSFTSSFFAVIDDGWIFFEFWLIIRTMKYVCRNK